MQQCEWIKYNKNVYLRGTMTAGLTLFFAFFAASTTPVRMFVRGSTLCKPLKPGVFGLLVKFLRSQDGIPVE